MKDDHKESRENQITKKEESVEKMKPKYVFPTLRRKGRSQMIATPGMIVPSQTTHKHKNWI